MDRIDRISCEMQKGISNIIISELKDPRIPIMTSVVAVRVTKDLKFARVYISVLGTEETKINAINALKHSAGFIRKTLASTMNLRNTPELEFILDNSIEYGTEMSAKIAEVIKEDGQKNG